MLLMMDWDIFKKKYMGTLPSTFEPVKCIEVKSNIALHSQKKFPFSSRFQVIIK